MSISDNLNFLNVQGERFFLTGAMGCIGAWIVRTLVAGGAAVTVFDLSTDARRMRLIMEPADLARVSFVQGDITQLQPVIDALQASGAAHLLHLAALQLPFCRADPPLGARVNVLGTVHLFEAARRLGLGRVVYASSVAVYGASEDYGEDVVGDEDALRPRTLYGVYKQANEGTARVYWLENGIESVGLRPHTVYGPGRDQGMTSAPTVAMLAAAGGLPWHIGFGGRFGMQYVRDVAEVFVRAALQPLRGAEVYNIRGSVVSMDAVVAAIEAAAPESRGRITWEERPLPLPAGQDDASLGRWLGDVPRTALDEGVRESITLFKSALALGLIAAPSQAQ